jgi:HD superfamily phosphohydrolase YqeK
MAFLYKSQNNDYPFLLYILRRNPDFQTVGKIIFLASEIHWDRNEPTESAGGIKPISTTANNANKESIDQTITVLTNNKYSPV